jgi:hypothetical protein
MVYLTMTARVSRVKENRQTVRKARSRSESVKTHFSQIYFPVVINSHAYLSESLKTPHPGSSASKVFGVVTHGFQSSS